MIDNQNSTTQKRIQNVLRRDKIIISQSRISRLIKEADYTRKRLGKIPITRNSPAMIEKRRLHCIGPRQIEDEDLLFLDESGFNSGMTRNYGYSSRGQKSVLANEFSRQRNTSLIAVISIRGCLAYEYYSGAINSTILEQFIREKLPNYREKNQKKTFVLDNVKFHHCENIARVCREKGISLRLLPPYSTQLIQSKISSV
ncbi:transposable element [Pseudoloma neurophilia]|uniref:Transposable element n=1 Tax=Pseudoloma neurophilia TaxID=146866 RepID=A0A0R0M5I6_9MICR|nr:transposable element [Pseudoloma neurophilia]